MGCFSARSSLATDLKVPQVLGKTGLPVYPRAGLETNVQQARRPSDHECLWESKAHKQGTIAKARNASRVLIKATWHQGSSKTRKH